MRVNTVMDDDTEPKYSFVHQNKHVDIMNITSKLIYWTLIETKTSHPRPTCVAKWANEYDITQDKDIWSVIFTIPFQA